MTAAFGITNRIKDATLSATSEVAELGVDQLRNDLGASSTSWQTAGEVKEATLTVDAGAVVPWQAFGLFKTNLSPTASVRVRCGSEEGLFEEAPTIDLNFGAADTFTPPGTGTWSFTRANVAWRCKSDGTWEEIATDIPRIHYDPVTGVRKGLMLEAATTNFIRNPRGEGLVATATPPTNMAAGLGGTMAVEWTGTGTEDGLPGFYVRVYGTTGVDAATSAVKIYLETTGGAAITANRVQLMGFLRVAAGGLASVASVALGTQELDAGAAVLVETTTSVAVTSARVGSQRYRHFRTTAGQTTVRPFVLVQGQFGGGSVDVTLFIAGTLLENGVSFGGRSTPLYPPVSSPAAVTTAADAANYTPPGGTIVDLTTVGGTAAGEFYTNTIGTTNAAASSVPQLDSGSNANRVAVRAATIIGGSFSSDILVTVSSVTAYDSLNPVAFTDAQNTKLTHVWAASGTTLEHYLNNVAGAGYAGTLPAGLTRLTLLANANQSVCVNRVRYWNRRLTTTRIQAISATGVTTVASALLYDSGTVTGAVKAGYAQAVFSAPAAISARYVVFNLSDIGNPDNFLRVAQAYAGPLLTPEVNMSFQSTFGRAAQVPTVVTRGGQEYAEFRFAQRGWQLMFTQLREAEVWSLTQELQRHGELGNNILFIPDPNSIYLQYEAVLGKMTQVSQLTWPSTVLDRRAWQVSITERL